MKKQFLILLMAFGLFANAQSTWKSDKAHSNMNFTVSHLVISEVTGKFNDFDIEAQADDTFSKPSFTVAIQAASIDTGNERRDGDLKSDHFFHAEKYPLISFKTTSLEKTGENTFKLGGDLTMHGITKPVTLDGKVNGIITDQRSQKLKAGLKFTGTVSRSEFGVGGDMVPVGDEVSITINTEMAQQ
jgi:polyisoprenoid-binding protein YceI